MITPKHLRSFVVLGMSVLTAIACGGAATTIPTAPATTTPQITEPATPQPTESVTPPPSESTQAGILIQQSDRALVLYDRSLAQTSFGDPGFEIGDSAHHNAAMLDHRFYVISPPTPGGEPAAIWEFTAEGGRKLDLAASGGITGIAVTFAPNTTDHPLVAWGEADFSQSPVTARLLIAPVDGFDVTIPAEQQTPEGFYFTPVRWAADGQRLYYSEEPTGLGGYILFGGFSTLYVYDPTNNSSTVVIPESVFNSMICLDDLSPDERYMANHCVPDVGIGLLDIQNAVQEITIAPPAEVADQVGAVGSARFSPDGTRLAFGLARNNPDDEQGWVAVADDFSGSSRLIATSPAADYFQVVGWLDDSTVILQSWGNTGSPAMIWLAPLDGSGAVQVGEGRFIGVYNGSEQ